MTPPDHIEVGGHRWELMEPGLYMRNHIGDIRVPDGPRFDISGSLNGLAVYLETPFPLPGAKHGETAMYKLDAGSTIKLVVAKLMEIA